MAAMANPVLKGILIEEAVAIGDVCRVGSAVLEVSQGRQPCWS